MNGSSFRTESLDGLRGIAVISVLFYHLIYTFSMEFGFSTYPILDFKYGFYGVELFFIISGYVIFFSLSKSGDIKAFLLKRFFRLYPTYWFCSLLTFLVVMLFPISESRNTNLYDFLIGLTMFQAFSDRTYVDPSYWSLFIELWFYITFTIVAALRLFKNIYSIISIWLLLVLINCLVLEIDYIGFLLNFKYGSLFAAGICFYKIKIDNDSSFKPKLLISISILTTIVSLNENAQIVLGTIIVYGLFFLALFVFPKFFSCSCFTFLGNISYPLYLIHQNIGFVILIHLKNHGMSNPLFVVIPLGVSLLISMWVVNYWEVIVIQKMKNKFFPWLLSVNYDRK
jgi:peptidoglycan/LPS O-acetylase OafA/YrhL